MPLEQQELHSVGKYVLFDAISQAFDSLRWRSARL
jgi:hypothetical protein